jgi:hypothetical protein
MKKKLNRKTILYLTESIEGAMKPIKLRLLKMDIARDLVLLRAEKEAINILLESFETEESKAINKEFLDLLTKNMQRIHAKQIKELKRQNPEMKDEEIENLVNSYQIQEEAELAIKSTWPKYAELMHTQALIQKQKTDALREESDFELTAVIRDSDLPEDDTMLPFESVAVMAYFFEEKA